MGSSHSDFLLLWRIEHPDANPTTIHFFGRHTPVLKPEDAAVFDNLGSYKEPRARQAIRAAGAHVLFLPSYSPDLNLIATVFAKLKTLPEKPTPV